MGCGASVGPKSSFVPGSVRLNTMGAIDRGLYSRPAGTHLVSRRVTRSICIKREEHRTERQQAKEPGQRQKREETAKSFLRSGSYAGWAYYWPWWFVVNQFVAAPAGTDISLQAVRRSSASLVTPSTHAGSRPRRSSCAWWRSSSTSPSARASAPASKATIAAPSREARRPEPGSGEPG